MTINTRARSGSVDRAARSRTLQQRDTLKDRHVFLAQTPDECRTLTERHLFLMGLVTLLLVLAAGIAGGSGVAWLLVSAWHHAD